MTTESLARQVLAVLDKQAEYFKSRDQKVLIVSKAMEKNLRTTCTLEIVKASKQQVLMETNG